MVAPKRYFDESNSDAGPSPKKFAKGGHGGKGGDNKFGGAKLNFKGDKGDRDDREQKEKFKPKEGFIAAGLRSYTEAAEEAKKTELSEGWKDKTTTQTTLHLTHLPPTLTSPQLSILCSSYAPLRSAFVVSTSSDSSSSSSRPPGGASSSANTISTGPGRDRTGKSTSRGFGYVRFVLRTDAEKCLKDWGNPDVGIPRSQVKELEGMEGMENVEWDKVCGRGGIKMGWAKKKLKEGEEPEGPAPGVKREREKKNKVVKEKVEEAPQREKREWIDYDAEGAPPRPLGAFDHSASRTVIIQGIPTIEEEEMAAEKAKKAKEEKDAEGSDDESEYEKEEEEKEEEGDDAHVPGKAVDWKKALKQKAKKSGDVEDVQWPVVLSSGETVATIRLVSPRQAHELAKKLHNHVFRGLVVSACVKSSWDLVQKMGRAKAGGRIIVRNLGFDITVADLRTVFSRFGNLHSITLPLNSETSQPRGFSFIYFLNKSSATSAIAAINGSRIYAGMASERVASEGGKEGKKKEVRLKRKQEKGETGGGGGEKGRVVAVDWALGKDEYKKLAVDEEKVVSGSEPGSDESGSESDSEDEDEEDEDSDTSPVPVGAEDADEHHSDDDDDELDEEPKGPEPPKGTTLFVRNIVFEATEAEVYDLFKSFGPVRYARIVYDPTTKRSRGTAFVCFWNDEDAQKVLAASSSLNAGLFVGETSNKKDKMQQQSLLMADPTMSGAGALTLHGRVLAAVSAVSKDDADKLREDRDKKGAAKTDRRNLYLMREGVIFPSWAIAQTLHPTDMTARQASFDARKGLLRSNPSLYISRTRLSIRQVPLYVSDGMLKRLANYAIKEFDREVKGGHQKALTPAELDNTIIDASGTLPLEKTERIRGVPPSRVRQAKILRQTDRVDPLTGLGRSKGYGFLELGSHADALRVLRWANANRDVGTLFRGWWRETLENLIEKEKNSADGEKQGKGITVRNREERVKRLSEKMAELVEEEELAKGKAAKREAKGKTTGEGGRSSKCLIIEFSIENQVTTKRRAEKAQRARERAKRSKDRTAGSGSDEEESDSDGEEEEKVKAKSNKRKSSDDSSAVKKKVKIANDKKKEILDAEGEDKGQASKLWTGSIIGKKRRQQKGKK